MDFSKKWTVTCLCVSWNTQISPIIISYFKKKSFTKGALLVYAGQIENKNKKSGK